MAQDFHAAFGVGGNDKHIAALDANGVALAVIQGLNQKEEVQAADLKAMHHEIQELKAAINELKQVVAGLSVRPQPGSH